ncbi:MAG: rod shape-determining protein RodA [Sphingomonadales bacterium]|nr:rod shape-determining protein RodA [Sphingomonadales bacterium]
MRQGVVPEVIAREPWELILPLFVLNTFGSVVLYSAAGGHLRPWALLHEIHFAVFLLMAFVISRMSREFFKMVAFPVYGALVGLLVLVELIGAVKGGSQRWLDVGFMQLQPSELMKPAIVLALARFFDLMPPGMTRTWRILVPLAGIVGVPALLVMMQPDLGTGLAITVGAAVVIFLAGLPMWWFVGAIGAVVVAAPLAFFTLLHGYQRDRVLIFLNPESDPLGKGYHITQSKIAIGSGGFWGKGFGNGSQSHLDYLPEAHTDFAFATMAEEWGLAGGIFVLAIFLWTFRWGMRVAQNAPDRFSGLLAAGMTFTIFFYMAINTMMVLGLAPVVGIPLPFISHGGSSMMTNMICVGTLMAVNRWNGRGGTLST